MKKLMKDVTGFGMASVGVGVSTAVVSKAGGNASGLNTLSGFMPIVGTAMMGGHALRMVDNLYGNKKRRRGGVL